MTRCPKCGGSVKHTPGKRSLERHGMCFFCWRGYDELKRHNIRNNHELKTTTTKGSTPTPPIEEKED